ncbi:hypothetical protein [Haloarcula laminariae]|uniref:hypothetical protein n=1 Tax=Haloarcula laminariae TaxID=2961577 RepID=UPI002404957A|nr:hypothetical protein [Halomicroarcula sp. FL173]
MAAGLKSVLRRYAPEGGIFLLALVLRVGYWLYSGTKTGGDWSGYAQACTLWATDPLSIVTAHKGIFYAGFSFPFCQVISVPGATLDT